MLGEIVFGAPAILEAEAVGLPVVTDLGSEERIEREQKRAARQFDNGAEFDLIGLAAARRDSVAALKGKSEAVALALNQFDIGSQTRPKLTIEVLRPTVAPCRA